MSEATPEPAPTPREESNLPSILAAIIIMLLCYQMLTMHRIQRRLDSADETVASMQTYFEGMEMSMATMPSGMLPPPGGSPQGLPTPRKPINPDLPLPPISGSKVCTPVPAGSGTGSSADAKPASH